MTSTQDERMNVRQSLGPKTLPLADDNAISWHTFSTMKGTDLIEHTDTSGFTSKDGTRAPPVTAKKTR